MMKRLLALFNSTVWAMDERAIEGFKIAANSSLSEADYACFHGADKDQVLAISAIMGSKIEGKKYSFINDCIGSIQINGPIIPRSDIFAEASGSTSIDRLASEFSDMLASDMVKEIALVIDSPGGSSTGVAEFASMVASSHKPVTAYVYGNALSAAYWIASAADRIVMGETSTVGSIGCIMRVKFDKSDDAIDIVASKSPRKKTDVRTDDGKAQAQELVDGIAEVFIESVAKNRGTTPENVSNNFGKGGIVMAKEAMVRGMADEMMTLSDWMKSRSKNKTKKKTKFVDTDAKTNPQMNSKDSEPKNMEAKEMTLTELLKEHPNLKAEIDAQIASAVGAAKIEAIKEHTAQTKLAQSIIASDDYPAFVKSKATEVLSGAINPEVLASTVAMYDQMKAAGIINDLKTQSTTIPATPATPTKSAAVDGIINTAADVDLIGAQLRAGR